MAIFLCPTILLFDVSIASVRHFVLSTSKKMTMNYLKKEFQNTVTFHREHRNVETQGIGIFSERQILAKLGQISPLNRILILT